ncbi:MAG: hypothetical protein GWP59_08575 [Chlamydiales bacterium]|nr:acyl carrier protein [Chlamydiales bacterium]NCF71740.1 hypothetical protein [Chlamydiales bacterium]
MTINHQELLEVAASTFEMESEKLSLESSRTNLAQWDSLNHLKLFMAIEQHFDVQFSPEDIVNLSSFSEIASALDKLLSSSR